MCGSRLPANPVAVACNVAHAPTHDYSRHAICPRPDTRAHAQGGGSLAFTRYCFTSRLYCTIIFFANTNTPFIVQYIAQYYQYYCPSHPRPILRCFSGVCVWRCLEVFICYLFSRSGVGFWMVEVSEKKNRSRHGKGGIIIIAHYCAIPPSQPPFIAYNIAQYIFPTPPFIAIKNIGNIL